MFTPLLATLLACSGGPAGDAPTTPGVSLVEPGESVPVDDPSHLSVAIVPRARDGGIPTELSIATSLPVFTRAQVNGPPPAGTVFRIEPEVPGELLVASRQQLLFRPSTPLAPSTSYTVTLEKLPAEGDPPWLGAWTPVSTTFATPAFGLLHATLREWKRGDAAVTLDLVYAAPVDPAEVESRLALTLDGAPLRAKTVVGGDAPEVVRVVAVGEALRGSKVGTASIGVSVAAGVPLVGRAGTLAAAASEAVEMLYDAPPVQLRAVKLREGTRGYYVDVVCDDGAVDEKRWWWDRETWDDYRISARCELDAESAASTVHLVPDVPFTVGPADGGFRVFADLPYGSASLRIDAGARTVDGGAFLTAVEEDLDIPHRTPRVSFSTPGRYLPRDAWDNLPVEHVNVPAIDVTIRHVPPENLVFWLSGSEPASANTSDVVAHRRVSVRAPFDESVTSWIDVGSLVPDAGSGVYEVALEGVAADALGPEEPPAPTEEASTSDTGMPPWRRAQSSQAAPRAAARIVLTDMHLIAKVAGPTPEAPWSPTVNVWTVGVHDNRPQAGVEISLVRTSGKAVATCRTGGDGSCALNLTRDPYGNGAPFAILARRGADVTYLRFADLQVRPESDVAGESYRTQAPWRSAVWTDRGVYRPGDTAHLAGLLRTEAHLAPAEAVPTLVKVFDPRAKELRRIVVETNAAGMFTVDVPFSDYATTGRYRAVVEVGGVQSGEATFNVEEFVPERLRVSLTSATPSLRVGDTPAFRLGASWLFGGAVKGAKADVSCRVEPASFAPKGYEGFHFGPLSLEDAPLSPIPLGSGEYRLDEEGLASVGCPPSAALDGLRGPATLIAHAAVFEGESGRTTVQDARVPLHPGATYVGVAVDQERSKGGVPVGVHGAVVDPQGVAAKGSTPVSIDLYELQEESGWMWDAEERTSRFRRVLRRVKLSSTTVTATDGKFDTTLTPSSSAAGWLVAATVGKSRSEVRIDGEGRRWWWSSIDTTVDQTPLPGRPTRLDIHVPDGAKVGERLTATVVAPYSGRILWTVETDHVVRSGWADAVAGENRWQFPIESFQPDYFVSALLLKDPHQESAEAFLPDRGFGVARVRVLPETFTVPVSLTVPAEVRPNAPLEVTVDARGIGDVGWVTVAAVDEGILSLTKFADPDPAEQIFAPRALGTTSYETIGWTLLHEPMGAGRRTGGDAASAGGRVQMVKPVALWSGLVPLGKDGTAKVRFDVPSYRGSLRVMAVVASPGRMGHQAASVAVREPLTLTTTVPRFLVSGDRAQIPVQVTNLSGAKVEATVKMSVTARPSDAEKVFVDVAGGAAAPLSFGGGQSGTLTLEKDATGTLVFQVNASAVGSAHIDVVATAGKLESKQGFEVPVVSPWPTVRMTEQFELRPGANDLSAALQGWAGGDDRTTVWVTRNPYARALTHLRMLLHYPYGCIEQTTSSTRPLLYARALLGSAAPDSGRGVNLDRMVAAGVDRVASMQTPSGGFAYWPGGREPVVWGTAYAAHMLLDARTEGFPVSDAVVNDALGWLERQLDRKDVYIGETAYAHYVLARAGRPHAAQAARALETRLDEASADRRYEPTFLLKAAIAASGDRRYEKELKSPAPRPIRFQRWGGYTYASDLRDEAMRLSVARELYGADADVQSLANSVAGALSDRPYSHWYTTQELAWGITALGRMVDPKVGKVAVPTLLSGGRTVTAAQGAAGSKPSGDADFTYTLARAVGSPLTLSLADTGGVTLHAVVTTEGHRIAGYVPYGGEGLSVDRRYLDATGAEIDPNGLSLGEAFFVELVVENPTNRSFDDLALVDRIAAGWEIENPRLGRGGLPDEYDAEDLWVPEHMNLRDDRVEVFGKLGPRGKVKVLYQVRAVTSGTWSLPEVAVESMYDPAVWARQPGQTVRVAGQWAGLLL